ncbi:hypothetical protein [Bifidobacterium tibiigranuli]|uniref:hypothetical protein n=1 Tax=Bifidobacterium tibiigranuli TaxID=2172043 RepID=UPI0026F09137|nr:hypothetical protein [Bifidobacterium tibiigranuli]MCI2185172.1 hypothetical protein [Bifidobacterium tibiigranuli]MCI2203263.1 hypothetical protein [Bifidobacterium tibiigranuli]
MKKAIQTMSPTVKNTIFVILYCIPLAFAIFPPLYLWGSGQAALFLGAPLSIWYWLFDFLFLVAIMFFFYWVESVRGEVDPEEDFAAGKERN